MENPEGQQVDASTAKPGAKTLVDRYLESLKNRRTVAVLVVVATVVVGIAQFTDAVSKLVSPFSKSSPPVVLPAIPGDSGWLLLAILDPTGAHYIRDPFFVVEKSTYPDKSLAPRKGDLVRLVVERNVVIAGYKKNGLTQQFMPPWQLNVLSEDDYTGVKLPKGALVEVRDVSLGAYPGQEQVVWARVAYPPK